MNHSAALAPKLRIQFPKRLKPLFQPFPYKIVHGGRGSSKSWSFCRALLAIGTTKPLFILCVREIQNSIDESVYKLLCDQITLMGLEHFYEIFDQEIVGRNGTRFAFAGIKNQFTKIKSYEAIDICAVFEAAHISKPAWDALEPTIRRDPPFGPFGEGSEIWIEFNPDLITDETYKRFVLDPPPGSFVISMNFFDNIWFPKILERQMERAKGKDLDDYNNVWCGQPKHVPAGAVYAKELDAAYKDDPPRISPHIRHDPKKPVTAVFDLGRRDATSIWFVQQFGMDHAVIDYYGNTGFDFSHYIDVINGREGEEDEKVRARRARYRVNRIILPHDARHKVISARFSVLQQARTEWGIDRVPKPLPKTPASTRINALRSLFPRLFFAEGPTQEGVQLLTHYRFGINDKGQRTLEPLHDDASHPANSLEHYAISLRPDIVERAPDDDEQGGEDWSNSDNVSVDDAYTGWMR